jgi:hypothetical protein
MITPIAAMKAIQDQSDFIPVSHLGCGVSLPQTGQNQRGKSALGHFRESTTKSGGPLCPVTGHDLRAAHVQKVLPNAAVRTRSNLRLPRRSAFASHLQPVDIDNVALALFKPRRLAGDTAYGAVRLLIAKALIACSVRTNSCSRVDDH